ALGIVAMKKFVFAGLALTALVWWWRAESRTEAEAPARAEIASDHTLAKDVAVAPGAEALPAPDGRRVESAQASEAAVAPVARPEPTRLTVHARWSDGTPAADEIVTVTTNWTRPDDALTTTTDVAGSAVLADLPAGGVHVKLLRGEEGNLLLREGQEHELTLEIPKGIDVDGRVRDARGEPVADAEIWLSLRYRVDLGHVIARTDARGEFHVRSVPTEHHVGALARGFAPSSLRAVRGTEGGRSQVELTLENAATPVLVEVVDGAGAPVASARILLGSEKPSGIRQDDGLFAPSAPPQRAVTGSDGRAKIEWAPLGPTELQARAEGCAPARVDVDVQAGGPNLFRIVLLVEAKLAGTVVDQDGLPVPGAWVSVGEDQRFSSASTHAAKDGSFEIDGLPSGTRRASIHHLTAGSAAREVELFAGRTAEWHATLVHEPCIEGEVRAADGSPVSNIGVVAATTGPGGRTTRSTQSEASGRFVIRGLEARSYTVSVFANDWRGFPLAEAVDVWPDRSPLLLKLDDSRGFGRITLRAVDPTGAAVGGVELLLGHVERNLWRTFTSDEAGKLQVGNVSPGTVDLELRHGAYPWKRLGKHALAPGATLDLGDVAFEAPGSLQVELRGPTPEECAKLQAALADASNHESGTTRIAGGRLTATALAPGKHTLMLGGEGWLQVRRDFEITAGARTEFTLDLVAAGVRELQFRWPSSSAMPGWIAFTLMDEHGAPVFSGNAACTEDPPNARVSAAPGTYRLWVKAAGELSGRAEIAMPAKGESSAPAVIELVAKT
ncbi:MAG TPA: carboxypeptidase-like regulatory domain-containing protein, partial [Planctomycetota bacterium]|nr:carboxypeptidase-like regulatory domain-containing protein [Planctomycetota bacterium]